MDERNPPGEPQTLLLHDGELGDVRRLLEALGTDFTERRGSVAPEDTSRGIDVVIATPQRLLDLELAMGGRRPTLIAICDSDTRSLRNSLSRAGIQLMVRRPVHPAALRALVLHAIYRGPEKRRSPRVSVGAPIRIKAGWRQRPAILADLSQGGCRVLTPHLLKPGGSITLCLPAEVGGGQALSVKARVLRHLGQNGDDYAFSATFEGLGSKKLEQLKRAIRAHAGGPATWRGDTAAAEPVPASREARPAAPPRPARPAAPVRAARPAPAAAAHGRTPGPAAVATVAPAAERSAERRAAPRRAMDRRVIALGNEAARVLMGRDISLGGMRVNYSPLLRVGESVRLAIHVDSLELPLVLTARVHRDDGERGIVLRFHELPPESTHELHRVLDTLPVIEPGADGDGGMIVSEILAEAQ